MHVMPRRFARTCIKCKAKHHVQTDGGTNRSKCPYPEGVKGQREDEVFSICTQICKKGHYQKCNYGARATKVTDLYGMGNEGVCYPFALRARDAS